MYLVCCVRDVLSPEFPARLVNILFLDFNPSRISILSPPGFFSLQAGALPSRFSLPIKYFIDIEQNGIQDTALVNQN